MLSIPLLLAVASGPTLACPETALGADTSTARLTSLEWRREDGVYLIELKLHVVDHPDFRTIKVGDQAVSAHVEHRTPFTLAHWLRGVGLLFGGASKFVVGAARDTETGEVAVIPMGSIKDVQVTQGPDFDENAPFEVTLVLASLHPPVPFEGALQPFEPWTGAGAVGEHWVRYIANDDPAHFDPYGQAYGDYFADPWYRMSFIHGPMEEGEFLSPDDPMPIERAVLYDPAQGFRVLWPGVSLASLLPQDQLGASIGQSGDLYRYLLATYEQLQPTTSLDALVGRPVELAIMGDRALVPPASPYTDYRSVCTFQPGRRYSPQKNALGFLGELAVREPPAALSWPTVGQAGPASPRAWQSARTASSRTDNGPRATEAAQAPTSPATGPAVAAPSAPASPSPLRWLWLVIAGGALFVAGMVAGRTQRGAAR
jgi:hypothetical protein